MSVKLQNDLDRKQCLPGISISAEGMAKTNTPCQYSRKTMPAVVVSLVLQKYKVLLKDRNVKVILKYLSGFLLNYIIKRYNNTREWPEAFHSSARTGHATSNLVSFFRIEPWVQAFLQVWYWFHSCSGPCPVCVEYHRDPISIGTDYCLAKSLYKIKALISISVSSIKFVCKYFPSSQSYYEWDCPLGGCHLAWLPLL